jgi:YHS domain-containing protein
VGVLFAWIVRVLAVLLLLRFVLRALFPPRRPASGRGAPRTGRPERLGGELVRDPVCGTYIPKATAVVSGSGSDATYFCSTKCRDEFTRSSGTSEPRA